MAAFAETFSSLKSFETCPRQWSEVTFYKNFPFSAKSSQQTTGHDVHKLIAESLSGGEPLPAGYEHVDKILDPIRASGFVLLPEYKMAVDSNMASVPYDSPNRIFRGDADLLAIDGGRGVVIDWKNGSSKYPDKNQLDAMALLAFGAFPELQTINGLIVFLQDNKTESKSMTRAQAPFVWKQWKDRIAAKQRAIASKSFAANPSGLCRGWCPVTTCAHHEPKQ
jgi:PD-(D/E)XK nuclease superfamily